MTPDLERQLVLAVIEGGSFAEALSAGITVDWLDDIQAKTAWQAITEYTNDTRTAGKVPGRSYLVERMAMVAGFRGSETIDQLVAAMRVARLRKLNAMAIEAAVSMNTENPSEAHAALLKALTSPEIEQLRSNGRSTSLADLVPALFKVYVSSMATAGVTGVPTSLGGITQTTKGWQRGELYCLYAPSGNFKSFLMLLFMIDAFRSFSGNVLFVTSEMPAEQCAVRTLCMLNGWNFNDYRDRSMPVPQVSAMLKQAGAERLHFYQPSGFDIQAIAEVRTKIQELNMKGGVSLVLWDGHYRSASKPEWDLISDLVKKTRALALEPEILQPPIIVSAQEGSEKGKPTNAVYRHESSLMMYLTKTSPNRALLQTTKVREGVNVEIDIEINFRNSSIVQLASKSPDGVASQGAGSLV